jgi:hypothetical protein
VCRSVARLVNAMPATFLCMEQHERRAMRINDTG